MATIYLRRAAQRAQLLQDGRKAIELTKTRPIADILLVIGGSRARLYRAMAVAMAHDQAQTIDPLLE
jgi:hypothetical protein